MEDDRVRGRTGSLIAWATLVVYWGLAGAGFLLRALNDPALDMADELAARIGWGAYPTVGAVIVARQPHNRIGWLCCAVGLLLGPAFFGQDYAWYALLHEPGLPGGWAMAWLGQWPWTIAVGLLWFLVLLFPNGQLVSPRWQPVAWALAVDLAALWVWAAFAPRPLETIGLEHLTNPLGLQQAEAAFTLLIGLALPIGALLAVLAVASMVVRFRRARGVERQQLKWFTYAATLVTLLWLVFFAAGLERLLPPLLVLITSDIWLAGIPAAIGIAVLRYRLYDIDRIINRTLVYGLLTAVLGLGYAGAVLLLGQLFGGLTNDPPSWAVAAATLAMAALFQPARHRIQATVERRFNRRKYNAAQTIEAFTARLRDEVDLDTLSAELLTVVEQTMQPTTASLWLQSSVQTSQRAGFEDLTVDNP
jgi:zinc transporter ZupT